MTNDFLNIYGVTEEQMYPPNICECLPNIICDTDQFILPCSNPDIKEITDVFVSLYLTNLKPLHTPLGKKMIVYGTKHVKIIYDSATPEESIHAAHFHIPLAICINGVSNLNEVFVAVEDIQLFFNDCRSFSIITVVGCIPLLSCAPAHNCHEPKGCAHTECGIGRKHFHNDESADFLHEEQVEMVECHICQKKKCLCFNDQFSVDSACHCQQDHVCDEHCMKHINGDQYERAHSSRDESCSHHPPHSPHSSQHEKKKQSLPYMKQVPNTLNNLYLTCGPISTIKK